MALPSSGTIKMSQVRDELKKTGPISLGNADVRKLGGKPSGTIKMSDLYGKSSIFDVELVSSFDYIDYDFSGWYSICATGYSELCDYGDSYYHPQHGSISNNNCYGTHIVGIYSIIYEIEEPPMSEQYDSGEELHIAVRSNVKNPLKGKTLTIKDVSGNVLFQDTNMNHCTGPSPITNIQRYEYIYFPKNIFLDNTTYHITIS